MAEDKKKRPMNKQMAEAMILSKLYRDGLFLVDEESRIVKVDMRRSRIVELYKEDSYDDVKDIMDRTVRGLKLAGYEVKARWLELEGMSSGSIAKIEEIQNIGSEIAEDIQAVLEKPEDGCVSEN